MDNEQLLLLYLESLGIFETETLSIHITANTNVGVQVGQGGCAAIVLRLNQFVENTSPGTANTAGYFYWGDSQKQDFEVLRGTNSQVIFTERLENILVRCPIVADTFIKVMVYRKRDKPKVFA